MWACGVPLTWIIVWESWDPSPMEQISSQTSVSRELTSWVEGKVHTQRLKHGDLEHHGNAHTKPAAPRNKKKSKQALHKEQLNSKHTSCTGQQGSKIRQAGQGGMRCLRASAAPRGCPNPSQSETGHSWQSGNFDCTWLPLTSDPPPC